MDLFDLAAEKKNKSNAPLAERMRPKNLDEFVGQSHIVGEGKYLNRLLKSGRVFSMIFYGPPGVGKTTLAEIFAGLSGYKFVRISAVTSGVKELRELLKTAEDDLKFNNVKTILFIDEIHRFNKSQQDALLPFVEKGLVTLIGATTENPYFEVNSALLSRCQIINLEPLKEEDLLLLIERALSEENGLKHLNVRLSEDAKKTLILLAGNDARSLLNNLEIAALSTPGRNGEIIIDKTDVENSVMKKKVLYDKNGNSHYDNISAFIKSMRGTDPDAAVFYLAQMLNSGEDPKFIARRMIIFASEDIGCANPMAIQVAVSCFDAVNIVGLPEGRIILSQCAIYLATSPKSNASYIAIDEALRDAREGKSYTIPMYLRDKHNPSVNNEENYKYPHSYGGYVRQDYLPIEFRDRKYFRPKSSGEEEKIIEFLKNIEENL
ncbi:replication-associated recombination protein A [Peptoniphilus sp. BV3AC2]|uniref:replication-associated recombination protein A n=1 Tax=Peptoniphilus sp. BV3AC2 TaxID=1111133 RepID=UPI0003B90AE7|nr:replication-associated recombination protein A [Peptoniphilus sp. BV3AC2]ERT65129.1 MgsA AAA+ ATPase family protein [Peptoniphilus sp. BV3AC2]